MSEIPLWEIKTHWLMRKRESSGDHTYAYKSWLDFTSCRPWQMWKPYDMISWSWNPAQNMLQIVFFTHANLSSLRYVEVPVQSQDEPAIRNWLKRHMPIYWKI